jgi:PilZ domain-containing protein
MKRRHRKRGSKAARPAQIPIDVEKAAGPSTALAEAGRQTHPGDEFIAPVEVKESGNDPTALAGTDYVIDLGDEFAAALEEEKLASDSVTLAEADHHTHARHEFTAAVEKKKPGPSVAPTGADRRAHPRYEFTAAVEVVAAESGKQVQTRLRDLSQQGCYVDTDKPLPLGTGADVRITKGAQSFEARARVVFSQSNKGMGLVFTTVEPRQLGTLEKWLGESRETSWLAANRRRSQRVLMKIPVRVSGRTSSGSHLDEATHTLAVSAHGALIAVSEKVKRGQRLSLSNLQTRSALECVVAHIGKRERDHIQVGVEFMLPNPIFWHVTFPPKDWTPRHPDAKPPLGTAKSS